MKFATKYGDQIRIIQSIGGLLLDNRFLVNQALGEGSYGLIFSGVDLMNIIDAGKHGQVYQPIIFKFTQQHETNEVEFDS